MTHHRSTLAPGQHHVFGRGAVSARSAQVHPRHGLSHRRGPLALLGVTLGRHPEHDDGLRAGHADDRIATPFSARF